MKITVIALSGERTGPRLQVPAPSPQQSSARNSGHQSFTEDKVRDGVGAIASTRGARAPRK